MLYQFHLGTAQGRQAINTILAGIRRMRGLSFMPETDTELARALIVAGPAWSSGTRAITGVARGVQLTYRWNIARKAANEVLQGGEKYAGQVDKFCEQTVKQLQKSIKSFEKQIAEHEQKIRDPRTASKDKDWDCMPPEHQKARLDGWKEDIQRAANYREMAKRVLQEKMQNTTVSEGDLKHVSKKL